MSEDFGPYKLDILFDRDGRPIHDVHAWAVMFEHDRVVRHTKVGVASVVAIWTGIDQSRDSDPAHGPLIYSCGVVVPVEGGVEVLRELHAASEDEILERHQLLCQWASRLPRPVERPEPNGDFL